MGADMRLKELGVSGLGEVEEPAFSAMAQRHRRELHVHCHRITEITTFHDGQFPRLGLPERLPADGTE